MEFHGTARQRNWRILNSMEFHGTAGVSEIGALQVPWNSMEFHGTARVSEIGAPQVPSSMELHGTSRVSEIGALQVLWNFMFFPWNCSCQRNWRTLSSMEFHGIPWNCSSHRNWRTPSSMEFHEFHGTARVSEIGALQVPWNSMKLLLSSKLAHY